MSRIIHWQKLLSNGYAWRCFSLCLVMMALLSACSTMTMPTNLPPDDTAKTNAQEKSDSRLSHGPGFKLNGKIAVRTPRDSGSATIDWLQSQDHFSVSMYGPLGAGGMRLTGKPGYVVLQTASGKSYRSSSPERLLSQGFGYHLPISNLRYWIQGLPVPNMPYKSHMDSHKRLITLTQAGFTVRYESYMFTRGHVLPNKLLIQSEALAARFVIYQWQVF